MGAAWKIQSYQGLIQFPSLAQGGDDHLSPFPNVPRSGTVSNTLTASASVILSPGVSVDFVTDANGQTDIQITLSFGLAVPGANVAGGMTKSNATSAFDLSGFSFTKSTGAYIPFGGETQVTFGDGYQAFGGFGGKGIPGSEFGGAFDYTFSMFKTYNAFETFIRYGFGGPPDTGPNPIPTE